MSSQTEAPTGTESFDAIIIGSGQGGNPLADALTAVGKKTALIERQDVGGTCINRSNRLLPESRPISGVLSA